MKLKCRGIIGDYKDAFRKGNFYEASELRSDVCDVYGDRLKRNGTPWTGVLSLGNIVVLGVASFEIVPEESDDPETDEDDTPQTVQGVDVEATEQA